MMDLSKNGPMLFPSCSRANHDGDTVICVGDSLTIGGDGFCVIAGPCAVESEEQIFAAAKAVKEGGAHMLRGGAFKPRTSPYAFQGLGEAGLELGTRKPLPPVRNGTLEAPLGNGEITLS